MRLCGVAPGVTLPSADLTGERFDEAARSNLLQRRSTPQDIARAVRYLLDADAAAVVSVGLDHREWLGSTVEAIGFEKAGIFRHGRPAIFGGRHMPRSIAELSYAMPGVRLIAYPVDPRAQGASVWWADGRMIRAMGREYLKYVRCTARMSVEHVYTWVAGRSTVARSEDAPRPSAPANGRFGPI